MADEFVTYKDLLSIINKIEETAKNDRHDLANQISKFMNDLSHEFDELKDWLSDIKVLKEKVNNMDKHISKVEKDSKFNKTEIEGLKKLVYIATWSVWAASVSVPYLLDYIIN